MPKCMSPLHHGPRNVSPAALVRVRQEVTSLCKPCKAKREWLRRQAITGLPGTMDQAEAWYASVQASRARDRALQAEGLRWCNLGGHVAPLATFADFLRLGRVRIVHRCRPCQAIYAIQAYARKHGRRLTWCQAQEQYARNRQHRTLARNRTAPPGQRWCAFGGHYRPLEAFPWRQAGRLRASTCRACSSIVQRVYRRRRAAVAA